ncbi:MAG: hypothetical protein ACKOPS_11165 [Cyanobium sp.]
MTDQQAQLRHRLSRFRDCHRGERLVLVCNGPSLNQTDFSLIRKEVSMGLNKIFLGFKKLHFYPRYYVAINRRVIEQSSSQIQRLNCIRFLRDLGAENPFPQSALTYFIPSRPEQRFHQDLCKGFFEGYTVTFAALQIAFFMGFAAVVIVGMDHRYTFEGAPNESRELSGPDPNHFDSSYFSGHTWDNPDLANSERFYAMAREAYEAAGRRSIDCTVNGACKVFEKGRIEEVLR